MRVFSFLLFLSMIVSIFSGVWFAAIFFLLAWFGMLVFISVVDANVEEILRRGY